jgi:hypothetical protein
MEEPKGEVESLSEMRERLKEREAKQEALGHVLYLHHFRDRGGKGRGGEHGRDEVEAKGEEGQAEAGQEALRHI